MNNSRQGSSLIMALMLMGSLISLTFGAATVFNKDLVSQRSVIDSAQAYYSAEAGVEKGLLRLSINKDDREPSSGSSAGKEIKLADTNNPVGSDGSYALNIWSIKADGGGYLLGDNGTLLADQPVDLSVASLGDSFQFEYTAGSNNKGVELIKIRDTDLSRLSQPPELFNSPSGNITLANTTMVRLIPRGGPVTNLKVSSSSGNINTGNITIDSLGMSANKEVKRLLSTKITPFSHPLLDFAVYSREGIN